MVNWTFSLVAALILFSMYSAAITLDDSALDKMFMDVNNTVIQTTKEQVISTGKKIGYFGLFAQMLNNLVPTFRYELFGINKYIVGVNDIPYFDGTDLFLMIPLLILPWFILKHKWKKKSMNRFLIILIMFLLILISFLVTKAVYYQLYLHSAQQIGLTKVQAIAIREGFIADTDESKTVLLMVSIMGGVAILYSFISKKKK